MQMSASPQCPQCPNPSTGPSCPLVLSVPSRCVPCCSSALRRRKAAFKWLQGTTTAQRGARSDTSAADCPQSVAGAACVTAAAGEQPAAMGAAAAAGAATGLLPGASPAAEAATGPRIRFAAWTGEPHVSRHGCRQGSQLVARRQHATAGRSVLRRAGR